MKNKDTLSQPDNLHISRQHETALETMSIKPYNPELFTVATFRYEELSNFWMMLSSLTYEIQVRNIQKRAQYARLIQFINYDLEWIGMLAWSTARNSFPERDAWIGYPDGLTPQTRELIIRNQFFVHKAPYHRSVSYGGASAVMAAALDELPRQWSEKFGVAPVLAETLIGKPNRFRRIQAYKEAGWSKASQADHTRRATYWLRPLDPFVKPALLAKQEESLAAPKHGSSEDERRRV
jgi:hypothetical protein